MKAPWHRSLPPARGRLIAGLILALGLPGRTELSAGTSAAPPAPVAAHDPSGQAELEAAPAGILSFDRVKTGDVGVGRTVFQGDRIEEFGVEILGKLEGIGPGQDLIIARLSGGPLAATGVLEGMSGSPVYIGGQLIGAVGYSWGFAREPIAGITPIEEMLREAREVDPALAPSSVPAASSSLRLPPGQSEPAAVLDRNRIVALERALASRLFSRDGEERASGARALPISLAVSGLPPSAFAPAHVLSAGASGTRPGAAAASSAPGALAPPLPGAAVGLSLVSGDVSVSAIGTVTHLDGRRVLAFGHPLFNLGPVDFPMTSARVEALLPSLQNSFKFATPGGEIGAIRSDRTNGVCGVIGARAHLIPVRLDLRVADAPVQSWKFVMVDHPAITPVLLYLTLQGILGTVQGPEAVASIVMEEGSAIRISGGRRISVADLYAGDDAAASAAATVAFLSQVLLENEFETARIEGIELTARLVRERNTARLSAAWCDRTEVRPGGTIGVSARIRPFRGAERTVSLKLAVPEELPPGPLTLLIGDAVSLLRQEAPDSPGGAPRDLDHLLRIINDLRRSERLYVVATRDDPSVLSNGALLPNLPASRARVLLSPQSGGDPGALRTRAVIEDSADLGLALEGFRRLSVEVLP